MSANISNDILLSVVAPAYNEQDNVRPLVETDCSGMCKAAWKLGNCYRQ